MSNPAAGGSLSAAAASRRSAGDGNEANEANDALEVRVADGTAVSIRSRARLRPYDATFTPRQREILVLVGDGLSNAEIASLLGISRRTVEKHVEAIHMKAGTGTRARLVAFAHLAGGVDS